MAKLTHEDIREIIQTHRPSEEPTPSLEELRKKYSGKPVSKEVRAQRMRERAQKLSAPEETIITYRPGPQGSKLVQIRDKDGTLVGEQG